MTNNVFTYDPNCEIVDALEIKPSVPTKPAVLVLRHDTDTYIELPPSPRLAEWVDINFEVLIAAHILDLKDENEVLKKRLEALEAKLK